MVRRFGVGCVWWLVAARAVVVLRIAVKVLGVLGLALSAKMLVDLLSVDFGMATIFPALNFFVVGLLILASVLALLS
jgi:hypothetical protein